MSQNEKVLQHLLAGRTISPLEAKGVYNIDRLAARIFELKTRGHDIETINRKDPVGKPYAEYRLVTRRRNGTRMAKAA